jgi:hypothetical protein
MAEIQSSGIPHVANYAVNNFKTFSSGSGAGDLRSNAQFIIFSRRKLLQDSTRAGVTRVKEM